MTSHVSGSRSGAAVRSPGRSSIGSGWVVFAGVMMIFGGLMTLFAGIAAIANDDVFVAARNYVYEFDITGWGCVHLLMGVVITLAGAALFQGATWARGASAWGWSAWPCSRTSSGSPTPRSGPSS
ncbi:hypothetical protein [Streptomyces sp. NPDC001536]|uniref:DUF7144 family membrane protein n=1 Tax=Streptomyces sp. NPDC001536 TaxID=3364583 RepID=UPI00368F3B13